MSVRLALIALVITPATAAANPAELYGFGSRHAARASAVSAAVSDFAAGYYNPAGLAFGVGKLLSFGTLMTASNLRANDQHQPIAEPLGMVIGASAPAPLGGPLRNRLFVGVGLYLLPGSLARIVARRPEEPFFPYYDSRAARLVVLPTIAARPLDELAVGLSLNLMGALGGQVYAAEGPTRSLDARVDEQVPPVARLNAGVRWQRTPALALALTYRQQFEVEFATRARTTVADQPINLDIRAVTLFTPHQAVAGAAWRRGSALVTVDLGWANWSAYPGPYVEVASQLPLLDPFAGTLPEVPWRDTVSARTGVEVERGPWMFRGGYGYETSPVPASQPGVTNLLDGPKQTFATGAGWVWHRPAHPGSVRIDLHLQAQVVGTRTLRKTVSTDPDEQVAQFDGLRDEDTDTDGIQISNPGYPSIESGGQVFSAGFTVEVAF